MNEFLREVLAVVVAPVPGPMVCGVRDSSQRGEGGGICSMRIEDGCLIRVGVLVPSLGVTAPLLGVRSASMNDFELVPCLSV